MKLNSIEAIINALNKAKVKYLVAGGLAVVAHGYLRFTADLDLIIHLEKDNLDRALSALKKLGYRPRAPVSIQAFADEKIRKQWLEEKDLKVFSLWSKAHSATEIDIFVEEPLDFMKAHSRKLLFRLSKTCRATVISFKDLIDLKKQAGRKKDIDDIEKLMLLKR